jgi:hypothetical protein
MTQYEISLGNPRSYLDSKEGKERLEHLTKQGYLIERLDDDGISEFVTLKITSPENKRSDL